MRIHELKTWPEPFSEVVRGDKTVEIRSSRDRSFRAGDLLLLRHFDNIRDSYEDRHGDTPEALVLVTHVVQGGSWGIPADLDVLSIRLLHYDGGIGLQAGLWLELPSPA